MQQTFWDKNKVFILGLLGAVLITAQPFFSEGQQHHDWKTIGAAILLAASSFVAREWRGQGLSITGIIGTTAFVYTEMANTGTITLPNFLIAVGLQVVTLAMPDPKSRGYENSEVIKKAKIEGDAIVHAKLTNVPKPEGDKTFLTGTPKQ